jgi:hypothetical protein
VCLNVPFPLGLEEPYLCSVQAPPETPANLCSVMAVEAKGREVVGDAIFRVLVDVVQLNGFPRLMADAAAAL